MMYQTLIKVIKSCLYSLILRQNENMSPVGSSGSQAICIVWTVWIWSINNGKSNVPRADAVIMVLQSEVWAQNTMSLLCQWPFRDSLTTQTYASHTHNMFLEADLLYALFYQTGMAFCSPLLSGRAIVLPTWYLKTIMARLVISSRDPTCRSIFNAGFVCKHNTTVFFSDAAITRGSNNYL